jgi:hypothetical protein
MLVDDEKCIETYSWKRKRRKATRNQSGSRVVL